MVGSFNNCKIIIFSHTATSSEYIDKISQVLLDGISENMSALMQTGNYGAINKTYTTKMGYYLIKFLSETDTLQ